MGVQIPPAQRSGTLRGESARILRTQQWETSVRPGYAGYSQDFRVPPARPGVGLGDTLGMTAKEAGAPCKRCRSGFDSHLLHARKLYFKRDVV